MTEDDARGSDSLSAPTLSAASSPLRPRARRYATVLDGPSAAQQQEQQHTSSPDTTSSATAVQLAVPGSLTRSSATTLLSSAQTAAATQPQPLSISSQSSSASQSSQSSSSSASALRALFASGSAPSTRALRASVRDVTDVDGFVRRLSEELRDRGFLVGVAQTRFDELAQITTLAVVFVSPVQFAREPPCRCTLCTNMHMRRVVESQLCVRQTATGLEATISTEQLDYDEMPLWLEDRIFHDLRYSLDTVVAERSPKSVARRAHPPDAWIRGAAVQLAVPSAVAVAAASAGGVGRSAAHSRSASASSSRTVVHNIKGYALRAQAVV